MGVLTASVPGGYTLNSKRIIELMDKIKIMFTIVLSVFLVFSAVSAMSVNAAIITPGTNAETGETEYTVSKDGETKTFSASTSHSIFAGYALDLVYMSYGGLFESMGSVELFNLNGVENMAKDVPSSSDGIWGLFGVLYESVAAAGVGLAVMWTMLNIIEKISEGRVTEETIISMFAKLLLASFIIIYGKQLCVTLLSLGNSFTSSFSTAVDQWANGKTPDNTALATEAFNKMEEISNGNVFYCCAAIIENSIPAVVMLVCWVIAFVQLISRIIELGIRTAFMPIGVADFMTHGMHSPGMHYLKTYIGVAAQGAALYLIMLIGITLMGSNDLLNTIFANDIEGPASGLASIGLSVGRTFMSVLIAITMIGLMKKADNLIREVFGR